MTTKHDLPRIFAFLSVLGTEGEQKGAIAWDAFAGWTPGPNIGRKPGEIGGGGGETSADDVAAERAHQRSAAKKLEEYRTALDALEKASREVARLMDIGCPPNPADMKNRRTGDLDPITPAEAAVSGWCAECWKVDSTSGVPIETDKRTGLRYYRDLCRWHGTIKGTYKVFPPREIVRMKLDGKTIPVSVLEDAMAKAIIAAAPKPKGKKRRKKQAA